MSFKVVIAVFILSFGGAFLLVSLNQPVSVIEKEIEVGVEENVEDVEAAPLSAIDICVQESMADKGVRERVNLKYLICQGAKIDDLSTLADLVNLEELYLQDNDLTSLETIPELDKLRVISVANNKNLTSLKGIEKPISLEELQANKAGIQDLSGVEALSNLKIVGLMMNDIENVDVFTSLEHLEDVTLNYNNIKDISAFAGKPKLREFQVYSNAVHDVTPLMENIKLKKVGVRGKGDIPCEQIEQLKSVLAEDAKVWGPKSCDAPAE